MDNLHELRSPLQQGLTRRVHQMKCQKMNIYNNTKLVEKNDYTRDSSYMLLYDQFTGS